MAALPTFPRLEALRIAVCRRTGFPLSIFFWWLVAAAWGALNALNYRYMMNPDGLSYLDMGREALRHGPGALVNAHWSPLYPALIALWNLIARPEPLHAFIHVHALNAVIYLGAAVAFGYLLRSIILLREATRGALWQQGAFVAFGFVLFLRYTNADILPFAVTPDILLSATIFAAGTCAFRIFREPERRSAYTSLGVALAIGYYAKSVMIPAGLCMLGILALFCYRSRAQLLNVGLAAVVMLVLCAPQIAAVSARVGALSISESGRLNQLWWVQGMRQFQGWTGTPGGDTPRHGPRLLVNNPEVLEFATPIAGTYPLWYDPAYWYAGARTHFDATKQWSAVRRNLGVFNDYPQEFWLPALGLILLGGIAICRRRWPGAAELLFLLWPVAVFVMYLLLYVDFRYVAPWLVVFLVAGYSSVLVRNGITERAVLLMLALTFLSLRLADLTAATRILAGQQSESSDMVVARELRAMGVAPGDTIAVVGEGFQHYYAHLAEARIAAQITSPTEFWALGSSQAFAVEEAVAETGVRALVAVNRPASFQPNYWFPIAGTPYSVLLIDRQ